MVLRGCDLATTIRRAEEIRGAVGAKEVMTTAGVTLGYGQHGRHFGAV